MAGPVIAALKRPGGGVGAGTSDQAVPSEIHVSFVAPEPPKRTTWPSSGSKAIAVRERGDGPVVAKRAHAAPSNSQGSCRRSRTPAFQV